MNSTPPVCFQGASIMADADVDIVSPGFHADPASTLEQIRPLGPIVRIKLPIMGKIALCTTHDTCSAFLKDHKTFVRDPANAGKMTQACILKLLPRTLSLLNVNSSEQITVTYWADGAYKRDALNKLNHFLRDSQTGEQTEMDPLVFDVLWHTMQISGYGGTVEVLSAFRSPEHNAWLASVSRGVARDSQHMNGNAMDIRFPGVPVFKIRQAARSLQMGGVGFYPRSGFVHLDTGPVRYW